MKFPPKSAEEIAEGGLLPNGDYDFEVADVEDAISKTSGNEMMVLSLKVHDGDGGSRTVRDYLVSSDGGLRKIRGFAAAVGLLQQYDTGEFGPSDILHASGRCKIAKDVNPGYEPKNKVAYYLDPSKQQASTAMPSRRAAAPPSRQSVAVDADLDDEIPF